MEKPDVHCVYMCTIVCTFSSTFFQTNSFHKRSAQNVSISHKIANFPMNSRMGSAPFRQKPRIFQNGESFQMVLKKHNTQLRYTRFVLSKKIKQLPCYKHQSRNTGYSEPKLILVKKIYMNKADRRLPMLTACLPASLLAYACRNKTI